ncbi:MAG: cysteine--tRNA ligase [Varibaculum sp.]|nr:cysteine--tRNA ligase [Varibaculum sp.]
MKLYDTKSRAVRELTPLIPNHVGIYLCGATVQGSPHIGHLRSALVFDILIRWLRRAGTEVTYIRNITDIDDKILNKSAQAGAQWWAWAARFEREFAAAYQALGIEPPTFEPRATAHIPDQIALVERLIERGHAYDDGAGNVYFDVHSLPDYGSLTHQALADMRTTEDEAQIDAVVEAGKRDPRDFALWKARKDGEPETASWNSPWGRGRPGWHLECSAMSRRYLGEAFDIHGGGIDLRFPHHENEQAQSRGAGWDFAQMWVHNAWVTVKGEKMSKSLGNSLVVSEVLKRTSAPVLRYVLGAAHYRSVVEYSDDTLAQAEASWERLTSFVERAAKSAPEVGEADREALARVPLPEAFTVAMDDDLNVPGALAAVFAEVKGGNAAIDAGDKTGVAVHGVAVRAMLDVLGLDPVTWGAGTDGAGVAGGTDSTREALDKLVQLNLVQRQGARANKDWGRADQIRDDLLACGITVEDGAGDSTWHL